MLRRLRNILLLLLLCALAGACSVTRKIPDGAYLVQKVRIEDDKSVPKKERITSTDLRRYVRQLPNKRFLGTNFYVWIYQQADSAKDNGWNRFKRRIGQAPVLLDMSLTRKSAENLKYYMDTRGFYSSRATYQVDTTSRRKRATITYRTHQGLPYHIRSLSYEFRDRFLQPIVLGDTVNSLIRPGDIFDIEQLDQERKRITRYLRQRGYFDFSVNNIEYVADTLTGDRKVDLTLVVKQFVAGYNERGEAVMDNNAVYRFDRINVLADYDPTVLHDSTFYRNLDTIYYQGLNVIYEGRPNLRPAVLRGTVSLYPNFLYDVDMVDRTYNNLMALGYFKSARISYAVSPRTVDMTNYVTYIGADGKPDSTSTAYTKEGYLDCNILCTPALRQGYRIELEGSTTSSFYGLSATIGYTNRNIFRGAESFDVAFTVGYEYMKARNVKRNAREFGVATGLVFPRIVLPFRTSAVRSVLLPRTRLELALNYQDRPYYRRTLTSAGWTYSWNSRKYSSYYIRPIDINVVDMHYVDSTFFNNLNNEYLRNSFKTQFIGGLSVGYVFNNQRKNLGGNATVVRFNAETAGNLIDLVARMLNGSDPALGYHRIFGIQYSQYARFDLSVSHKIMLGEVTAIVGRLYGGAGRPYGNSTSIPFDRLFYAGGSNSMRGWAPRTLGPGSLPKSDFDQDYPTQLGDMKLEANLELRFPIWGILHGAAFADVGNVWYIKQDKTAYPEAAVFRVGDFYRQLGFDAGVGIRLDIRFAILRLDWGIQIHNPNNPAGERWIRNLRWKNTALNLGVGYPF